MSTRQPLLAAIVRLERRIQSLAQQYQAEHLKVLKLERRVSNLRWAWAVSAMVAGLLLLSAALLLLAGG